MVTGAPEWEEEGTECELGEFPGEVWGPSLGRGAAAEVLT